MFVLPVRGLISNKNLNLEATCQCSALSIVSTVENDIIKKIIVFKVPETLKVNENINYLVRYCVITHVD